MEYVDFGPKILLMRTPKGRNSIILLTLLVIIQGFKSRRKFGPSNIISINHKFNSRFTLFLFSKCHAYSAGLQSNHPVLLGFFSRCHPYSAYFWLFGHFMDLVKVGLQSNHSCFTVFFCFLNVMHIQQIFGYLGNLWI